MTPVFIEIDRCIQVLQINEILLEFFFPIFFAGCFHQFFEKNLLQNVPFDV